MSATVTAVSAGLVTGFALQDGDAIARVSNLAGPFALGATVTPSGTITTSNAPPAAGQLNVTSSVTVVTSTVAGGTVVLPVIPPGAMVRVYNKSVTIDTVHVYVPVAGQMMNGVAAPFTNLAGNNACEYLYLGVINGIGQWLSATLGVPQA
jgi:hypothetical protein